MSKSILSTRQDGKPRVAFFIDGSALFLAAKSVGDGKQLDYRSLAAYLCDTIQTSLHVNDFHAMWVMWTSVAPENAGQARFLDFAENELGWTVRRFAPTDSYMVEPVAAFGLTTDSRAVSRLVRFDASIGFAIGRLAASHNIVVVSDSFPLAEPLLRSARIPGEKNRKSYLAFFGRALDSRWQRVLRTEPDLAPEFIDLDEVQSHLFGGNENSKEVIKTALTDTFLVE